MRKALWAGLLAAGSSAWLVARAQAETIRIANHGQAGIDAMKATVAVIEKKYGVTVEAEYPPRTRTTSTSS